MCKVLWDKRGVSPLAVLGGVHMVATVRANGAVPLPRITMIYALYKLAPGSYDLELDGALIGGVVRTISPGETSWTAELLAPVPAGEHPVPFTASRNEDQSGSAAWLAFTGSGPPN